MQSIYHFILLIVAAVAIFIGYRKGLIKQLAGIVGMILGIVSVHLFSDSVEPIIREQFPSFQGGFLEDYTYSVVTACVIFLAVYVAMQLLSFAFKHVLGALNLGILNSLLGVVFCVFKFMLVMSVLYNIIISIDTDSSLVDYCNADDGNIVGVVMGMAPAILDIDSANDLLYMKQKEEAKSISYNNYNVSDVYSYYQNVKQA
ncbi:MAG: CvpA family protein [Bacteroidales bacterium]|nr:CvpA family protein [Bacteroidales bacterium]